jgi:hypothetical protein
MSRHYGAGKTAAPPDCAEPERWQHGSVKPMLAPGVRTQRIANGVETLREAGQIGDPEVVAADRWYANYALGVLGGRDPERTGGGGSSDCHTGMLARARAVEMHNAVQASIGATFTQWLDKLLVQRWSFTAMAEHFTPGMSRQSASTTMAARCAMLLMVLSEVYAAIDKRRLSRK